MDKAKVMVIGGCNLDIQGVPFAAGQASDSLPGKVVMTPGGAGRNIAENIARLGNPVQLVSVVGADEAGQRLLAMTSAAGVDVASVYQLADRDTSVYLSILDHQHELIQAINDMQIIDQLTPELLAKQLTKLDDYQALVVEANLTPETLEYLFSLKLSLPIFADCVSASKAARLMPWLGKIFCLKPNALEAELLWGRPIKDEQDLKQCANWLHDQGVAQVFISLGNKGLLASASNQQLFIEAKPIKVVSAAGAGDALMAGLVHSHLQQLDLASNIKLAQACAAIALAYHSTVNPAMNREAVEE